MATVEQAVCTGVRNVRARTRDSLHPILQWAALEGCTAVALMAEHDDAEHASGQCARACGALTRVRRACLRCAQRACATPLPRGGAKARSSARGQRDVAVCLTSSAASAFVYAGQVRSVALAHPVPSLSVPQSVTSPDLQINIFLVHRGSPWSVTIDPAREGTPSRQPILLSPS